MSRHASDPPDKLVWPSGRIGVAAGRGSEDEDREPERLAASGWRKAALTGVVLAVAGGAGIWVAGSGSQEPGTMLVNSTPAPARSDWEAVLPPPEQEETAGSSWKPPAASAEKTEKAEPPAEPSASTGPRVETRPSRLTVKEAQQVHDQHARNLSITQFTMDSRAMSKLEQGLALEMSQANFETARMQGTKVPAGPWPKPKVWVPRDTKGTTDWFLAVSHQQGVARVSKVMTHTSAGWRLTAFTADPRTPPAALPGIATDTGGYATSLPENASGLLATPRQIAQAHLESLESTTPDPRFAGGPWTDEAVRFWRQERAQLERAGWRLSLSYLPEGPVRSIMTSDGGALIWYGARSTDLREARRDGATVTLKGAAAVRTGGESFARSASVTYGRMYAAYIPPAGSNEKVRVLGEWSEVLESHGT
ncbi:hypothetical protein [Planomonospora venezuelensis]|uniref:DUF8094 domain-containing protein n=1 Tax=Planomonospora venezuelensis TaxID=1999 RepID=A0A841DD40_PLAVE|nr:hypothetical protein [Planomonospora venezuelensis]MBB5966737.1 hypothetical protein [Planomonospora venezuelensis]GIN01760.1 hypothetical protein Pve01_34180 [Planomonospora venezuelensis]